MLDTSDTLVAITLFLKPPNNLLNLHKKECYTIGSVTNLSIYQSPKHAVYVNGFLLPVHGPEEIWYKKVEKLFIET